MEEAKFMQRTAAYTDIDGTVTAYNTIFGLLKFDAAERGCASKAEEFLQELRSAALNGVPRSETNARYFGWWRGRSVRELEELGERWADFQDSSPAAASAPAHTSGPADVSGPTHVSGPAQDTPPEEWGFLEPVAALLDGHVRAGRRIVAVTASFPPALVRVLRRWPTLELLCAELVTERGVYTGGIDEAMVGEAKAKAVAAHASRNRIDLAGSFAYGDHASDVPFMRLAGHSLMIGNSGLSAQMPVNYALRQEFSKR